jgi:hypothetical protein
MPGEDAWTERYRQERAHAEWPPGLPRLVAHVLFAVRTYEPPLGGGHSPRYTDLMRVVCCSRGTVERAIRMLRAKGHLPVIERGSVVVRVQAALRTRDAMPGTPPSLRELAQLAGCSKAQAWRASVFLRDGGRLPR